MGNVGLTGEQVTLLVAGGVGIVQAISVIPAILFLDQWGRWPLLPFSQLDLSFVGRKPLLKSNNIVLQVSLSHKLLHRGQCCYDHLTLFNCHIGIIIPPSFGLLLNEDSKIFQYEDDWPSHPGAAWLAVVYVQLPSSYMILKLSYVMD